MVALSDALRSRLQTHFENVSMQKCYPPENLALESIELGPLDDIKTAGKIKELNIRYCRTMPLVKDNEIFLACYYGWSTEKNAPEETAFTIYSQEQLHKMNEGNVGCVQRTSWVTLELPEELYRSFLKPIIVLDMPIPATEPCEITAITTPKGRFSWAGRLIKRLFD